MISTTVTENEKKEFIPKTITPGNQVVKITGVHFYKGYKDEELNVVLDVEGEPLAEPFEGFLINKDKPELGRHAGQVGRVKLQRNAFNNKEYVNGQWVDSTKNTPAAPTACRDGKIVYAFNMLFKECGKKLSDLGESFENWQEFEEIFNKKNPLKDIWFEMAIGAREYYNKENYKNYDLFILPRTNTEKAYKLADNTLVDIVHFSWDNPKHFYPAKEVVMTSTTGEVTPPPAPQLDQPAEDTLPF